MLTEGRYGKPMIRSFLPAGSSAQTTVVVMARRLLSGLPRVCPIAAASTGMPVAWPTMTPLRWKLAASTVLVAGVVLSAALVLWAGSADQCPDSFTQAQVDESGCRVGANIGLGVTWLFVVPFVMAVAGLVAARLWRRP